MKPAFAGQSDKGLIRAVNQDAYHIDEAGRFFIVADGMGGHAAGQDASRIAKDAICHHLEVGYDQDDTPETLLRTAFIGANTAIMEDQLVHPENADMGTTAVAILLQPGPDGDIAQVWCANLGDSRIYRFRNGTLEQLTEDDTWVAQAIKAGVLPADEARDHPWRHVLSQCLGREDMGELEIRGLDVTPGDQFLLCSDGLSEELTDDRIAEELTASQDCDDAATRLIEAAKAQGGRDNITVVLVRL